MSSNQCNQLISIHKWFILICIFEYSLELESQLSSAETRSQLLEKQLDYMRKMVQNAESDRQDAMVTNALMKTKDRYGLSTTELKDHDHKISDLEREHLKLTATQTLSEVKIQECSTKW